MKHSLLVIAALMLVMACTPSVPSEYIQPGDMEDILYDYHLSQAMVKTDNPGDIGSYDRTKYFLAVLKKHGVTEAEFDSSLVYYYSHLVRLKEIYAEVNERLADEAKELGATVGDITRYSQYSAAGDTANIWSEVSNLLLIPRPTMNRFDFTVKVDTSFYKGDSFMLQFMSEYIWQNGMKDAVACIVTKYEGDSIIQTVNHISVSGLSQIRIPANNESKLKEMRGYIYLSSGNDGPDNTRKMMFISQIQLIRFHHKEVKNETAKEPLKTDSVQSSDDAGRPLSDTVRGGVRERHLGKPLPVKPRIAEHRVVPGGNRPSAAD